jgi:hypothetical protein
MRTILAALCFTAVAFGQTVFLDKSPAESPLTFTTSIENGWCLLHGHNSDPRAIVAWVVALQGTKNDGGPYVSGMKTDHFFRDENKIYEQGYDFASDYPCTELRNADDATITATFVQFDDGSFWGSKDDANFILQHRLDDIDYLKKLQATPILKEALSKPPDNDKNNAKAGEWFRLTKTNMTPQEMTEYINERFTLAAQRKGWLDRLKPKPEKKK